MPSLNKTPLPDWKALPDEIASVEVARLFGVKPGSLSQYVKRNQLAKPVRVEANAAWYARSDVRDFWERRERRAAQYYAPPTRPPTGLQSPAVPTSERGDSLVPAPSEAVIAALSAAVADGVRQAQAETIAPLLTELKELREEVARLRGVVTDSQYEPGTPPTKTFWDRIFGR